MNGLRLTYASREDATPERERSALATALAILFEDVEGKDEIAAARPGDGNDGKDDQEVPADGIVRHS